MIQGQMGTGKANFSVPAIITFSVDAKIWYAAETCSSHEPHFYLILFDVYSRKRTLLGLISFKDGMMRYLFKMV